MACMITVLTESNEKSIITLGQLDQENDFSSEELQELFYCFSSDHTYVGGGGAAPLFLVKLYEIGDENLDWNALFSRTLH